MFHPGPETLDVLGKHPHARADVLTGHSVVPCESRECCGELEVPECPVSFGFYV